MNKQAVVDVLNSLKVLDRNGGDDAYILIEKNEENRSRLNGVGVSDEIIDSYSEDDTTCIMSMAFGEKFADEYEGGRFVVWQGIDDDLRYRVLNGEGTPIDAERLLRMLEPNLYGC